MKPKFLIATIGLFATLTFSGCSIFYPNPNTTPTATKTPTETPTETPTVDPELKKVDINIIDASAFKDNGTIDIIAEASGILEDDGNCTLKLVQGKISQTVTVEAESNVSSTQCFPMSVSISEFKIGDVAYTVSYKSPKHSGTISGTVTVQ